jgi:hypothetical protein
VLPAAASLAIEAPQKIMQGERLKMAVVFPDPALTYHWYLEGAGIGTFNGTGPAVQVPAAGHGIINVTVAARDAAGEAVAVGHTQVVVENLKPRIRSFQVQTDSPVPGTYTLRLSADVDDPGGDPVTLQWYLDHEPVGRGAVMDAVLDRHGWVHVALVATDDGGLYTVVDRPVYVDDPWIIQEKDAAPNATGLDQASLGEEESKKRSLSGPGALAGLLLVALVAGLRRRQ